MLEQASVDENYYTPSVLSGRLSPNVTVKLTPDSTLRMDSDLLAVITSDHIVSSPNFVPSIATGASTETNSDCKLEEQV